MREAKVNVYQFNELSEDAKQKVLEKFAYMAMGNDTQFWFENLQYDADENASFNLTGVDDNPISGEGSFKVDAITTADRIMSNCGESTDLYKLAAAFLVERDEAVDSAPKDENGDFEDEDALDTILDDIENDFESNVAHEFGKLWSQELEYQTSEAALIENIEANEYEFNEDGTFPARVREVAVC